VSTPLLLGLYQPGHTWVHRLPAGAKLLALLVVGVAAAVLTGPWSAVGLVGVALVLLAWVGGLTRRTLRGLRGLAVVRALLGAYHVWSSGWPRAVERVGDLLALVLLATVVTITTSTDDVVDAVTRALRPLRRLGVNPDAVGLAFSLMLRAIPATAEIADETRQAARARGLDRNPRARLTPLVIRVVARARMTGEALHARGVMDV
jgi:biotin transport system permease protein